LRTQQIVAYESGIADTADPLAGSYYIEELTDRIYSEAKKYIARIDDLGGMVEAIEKGFVQQEIQDSAYSYQLEVEKGEQVVVGVNKFQVKEDPPSNLLKVDRSIQVSQIAKIQDVKSSRDNELVKAKLAEIKKTAQTSDNLMPKILDAVKVYATLGEITGTMQEVFGEHKESVVL